MVASNQHKKQRLIFNQNASDLCSCLLLVITYAMRLVNFRLNGMLGYWLCMILLSENILWCSLDASVLNLVSITVERYLKVVHRTRSKKLLRKRVIHLVIAFTWIGSVIYNQALVFTTSAVVDGVCESRVIWSSRVTKIIHTVWYFISFHVIVVGIFIFCYGRILVVIRRQARVMAAQTGPGSSTSQAHTRIQSNIIKTMILVSAFYVIAWSPIRIYNALSVLTTSLKFFEFVYFDLTFAAFLYICANPFIYAIKFEPVKRILANFILCKKPQQTGENFDTSGHHSVRVRPNTRTGP